MLGFADGWVTAAYVLSLLSTVLCVAYGLIHWNDEEAEPPAAVHPPDENLDFEEAL